MAYVARVHLIECPVCDHPNHGSRTCGAKENDSPCYCRGNFIDPDEGYDDPDEGYDDLEDE